MGFSLINHQSLGFSLFMEPPKKKTPSVISIFPFSAWVHRSAAGVFERTPAAALPNESATHETSPALAAATSLVGLPGDC